MDGLGDNLLAGTALAVNQHAHVRLRHHPGLLQQALHQRATGHNRLAPALIGRRRALLQRVINGFIQGVFIHRLGEKAKHTLLGRGDGVRNGTVRGENNHRHSRLHLLDFAEQLKAVHLVHPQIADHQIHFVTAQHAQRLRPALGGQHAVSFADKTHAQQLQQARIVVH